MERHGEVAKDGGGGREAAGGWFASILSVRIYGASVSSHQSIAAHSKDEFVSLCNL